MQTNKTWNTASSQRGWWPEIQPKRFFFFAKSRNNFVPFSIKNNPSFFWGGEQINLLLGFLCGKRSGNDRCWCYHFLWLTFAACRAQAQARADSEATLCQIQEHKLSIFIGRKKVGAGKTKKIKNESVASPQLVIFSSLQFNFIKPVTMSCWRHQFPFKHWS